LSGGANQTLLNRAVLSHLAKKGDYIGCVNVSKGGTSRRAIGKTKDTASAALAGLGEMVCPNYPQYGVDLAIVGNLQSRVEEQGVVPHEGEIDDAGEEESEEEDE
jgi:hypothetical protein